MSFWGSPTATPQWLSRFTSTAPQETDEPFDNTIVGAKRQKNGSPTISENIEKSPKKKSKLTNKEMRDIILADSQKLEEKISDLQLTRFVKTIKETAPYGITKELSEMIETQFDNCESIKKKIKKLEDNGLIHNVNEMTSIELFIPVENEVNTNEVDTGADGPNDNLPVSNDLNVKELLLQSPKVEDKLDESMETIFNIMSNEDEKNRIKNKINKYLQVNENEKIQLEFKNKHFNAVDSLSNDMGVGYAQFGGHLVAMDEFLKQNYPAIKLYDYITEILELKIEIGENALFCFKFKDNPSEIKKKQEKEEEKKKKKQISNKKSYSKVKDKKEKEKKERERLRLENEELKEQLLNNQINQSISEFNETINSNSVQSMAKLRNEFENKIENGEDSDLQSLLMYLYNKLNERLRIEMEKGTNELNMEIGQDYELDDDVLDVVGKYSDKIKKYSEFEEEDVDLDTINNYNNKNNKEMNDFIVKSNNLAQTDAELINKARKLGASVGNENENDIINVNEAGDGQGSGQGSGSGSSSSSDGDEPVGASVGNKKEKKKRGANNYTRVKVALKSDEFGENVATTMAKVKENENDLIGFIGITLKTSTLATEMEKEKKVIRNFKAGDMSYTMFGNNPNVMK